LPAVGVSCSIVGGTVAGLLGARPSLEALHSMLAWPPVVLSLQNQARSPGRLAVQHFLGIASVLIWAAMPAANGPGYFIRADMR